MSSAPSDDPAADPLAADRAKLLAHCLTEADFGGWSVETLRRAAHAAGITRETQLLAFPRGVVDVLIAYSHACDARMEAELAAEDLTALKIRERIALAVRTRLMAMADHRQAAASAMHFLTLPMHGATATRLLYRTVDAVWRACGDTSTDFNFYSKRAVLAGVYSATFLIWQNDDSEDFEASWGFLDRRIGEVMQFEKAKGKLMAEIEKLPSPVGLLSRLRYGARPR